MSKPQKIDRLALVREALRILDGEAPEELVVQGDGWSLTDPASVRQEQALDETVVVSVPVAPVSRRTETRPSSHADELLGAIGAALDEAISDGWTLAEEPATSASASRESANDTERSRPAPSSSPKPVHASPDQGTPRERAVLAAGESMAKALHEAGGMPEYEENSPAFWRQFWAKSA